MVPIVRIVAWGVLGLVLAVGCGPRVVLEDGGTTDEAGSTGEPPPPPPPPNPSTTSTTTSPPPPTTSPPPDPDSTSDEGTDEGNVFIMDPDGGPPGDECDFYEQDCPPGFRCTPYSYEGGTGWNALGCKPLDPTPVGEGEPCTTVGHPWSGEDDCDATSMCFGADDETLEGTCFGFCLGEESNPVCAQPGHVCTAGGDGIGLCFPSCDPLMQDCPDGQGCYPFADMFICAPVAMELPAGQPCEFVNVCEPGTFCANDRDVPDCMGLGCCSPYCQVGDPMPPCLPGQECVPWFEAGQAPPGLELVGGCTVAP